MFVGVFEDENATEDTSEALLNVSHGVRGEASCDFAALVKFPFRKYISITTLPVSKQE